MRATAITISLGAPKERGRHLFADTTVSSHNTPAWFRARASCRAIFHR